MSDRAARRWRWTVLSLVAIALADGGALAAQASAARTADSLRTLLVAARERSLASDSAFEAAQKAVGAGRDRRLVAGGVTVRFTPAEVTDVDTAAIARGLEAGDADLVARFGEEGATLLRSPATWVASSNPDRSRMIAWVYLQAGPEASRASGTTLRRPIDPDEVRRFVWEIAAERLGFQVPWVDVYTSASHALPRSERHYAAAAIEMSLSWASSGRRCATGVVAACELVMTTRSPEDPIPAWFDQTDVRSAVTAAAVPQYADSALVVDRQECLRGDLERCARVLPRVHVRDPFSGDLRASLVGHAIERGGREAIPRLKTAPVGTPVARLAFVAGMSSDDLLRSWQARTAAALEAERASTVPLAASTLVWVALLVGLTTRRRP